MHRNFFEAQDFRIGRHDVALFAVLIQAAFECLDFLSELLLLRYVLDGELELLLFERLYQKIGRAHLHRVHDGLGLADCG